MTTFVGPAAGERSIALMYHAVGESAGPGADPHYTVSVPQISEQLALCRKLAGAVVSAHHWLAGRSGVVMTFDDGHESNHHVALPILLAAGATAEFFVNPAQVGTPGFATWAELREMSEHGMSIQSHGLDHRHYLTDLSSSQLRDELRRARLQIEEHVGRPVTILAPPGGRSPSGLTQVAEEVGYTHVMTSQPGQILRDRKGTLPRMAVTAALDLASLESWLRGGSALKRAQLRYAVLGLAKRALGNTLYETVRRRLLGGSPDALS